MNTGSNAYIKVATTKKKQVWFAGTTAVKEGQAVCYNSDYGTAASADGSRINRVEVPSTSNNMFFAGVSARAYSAKATGQMIEIYEPGSVCNVYTTVDTVINTGDITCIAGGSNAGYFGVAGLRGRGTATPMQTVTAGTGSLVLCKLQDGEESGLVEYITPSATGGGTQAIMVGGVTRFIGTVTIGTGDITATLADGTAWGQKKVFFCDGTYTTNDVVVALATAGKQVSVTDAIDIAGDGTPLALVSAEFDAANEFLALEWNGIWVEKAHAGCALAAS